MSEDTQVCGTCARPVQDGYLCHTCLGTLRGVIRSVPEWADQLTIVLTRLTRYTDPSGRRNAAAPLPFNPAATEPARRVDKAIRDTAQAVGAPGAVRAARLGVVAWWLTGNMDALRARQDAAHWDSAITRAVARAAEVCDRPPEQWYAGRCEGCGRDLYPTTEDDPITCRCGATWRADERRAALLAKLRETEAPGPLIARALSALGPRPVTPERLRQWRHAGLLEVRRMTREPAATNWYRVGDVLDLMGRDGRRRKHGR